MKKRKKFNLVNLIIFLVVVVAISLSLLNFEKKPTTDIEVVQCIGEKATLYVQLGCPHCKNQEEMFGDNLKYITIIDCFYEDEKCREIETVPTWKVRGENYVGVKSIDELRELTRC